MGRRGEERGFRTRVDHLESPHCIIWPPQHSVKGTRGDGSIEKLQNDGCWVYDLVLKG